MAGALQSCRFGPSPALSASRRPPGMSPVINPTPGRRHRFCFPGLKLQQGNTAAAAAAAFRPRVVVRAQNGGRHAQQLQRQSVGKHFAEEREHVMTRYANIIHTDHGCLYIEATAMSAQVCLSANKALKMASRVMDVAYLKNLDASAPDEISPTTVYMTLLKYVDIFLDAADAAYDKTVHKETVASFLGALRGLASISHILLESALEALTHTHLRESLSEYAFNCDVKDMRREFNQRMNDLEDGIRKASAVEICKLAVPAIYEGLKITGSFVSVMVARRERALKGRPTTVAMQ